MSTREYTCPHGRTYYLCAVSGGTLEDYIKGLSGTFCLRISPSHMDFPLPCPEGTGRSLSQSELKALYQNQPTHYSPELCMEYFTYMEGDHLHLVLFDTLRSLREKYRLAKRLKVKSICIPDPKLRQQLLDPHTKKRPG